MLFVLQQRCLPVCKDRARSGARSDNTDGGGAGEGVRPTSGLTLSYCLNTTFVKKKSTFFLNEMKKKDEELHKPSAQTPSSPGASQALWALPRPGQVPSLMAHAVLIQGHLSAHLCPFPDSEPLT